MLERIERVEVGRESRGIRFAFPAPPRTGRRVAALREARKAYGDNVVYAGVAFEVERGERVALVGPNGAGKSTLLRLLAGVLPLDGGERALGAHVAVHYYAQHQLDALTPALTVLEELERAAPELGQTRLRTILGAFLFSGDAVDKKIAVLSGGEKARVALAKMLVRPAALLCMDEPTNHLDLASREVLEQALATFPGTIVFISHDRYFINRLATTIVEIVRGILTRHLGNYDDYLAAKTRAAADATPGEGVGGGSSARYPTRSEPPPTPSPVRDARSTRASRAPGARRGGGGGGRGSSVRARGGSVGSPTASATTAAAGSGPAISRWITSSRWAAAGDPRGATSFPPARTATRKSSRWCRSSGRRISARSAPSPTTDRALSESLDVDAFRWARVQWHRSRALE